MTTKRIGIVMGSDSDLPTMQETIDMLRELDIEFDVNVISCHRTPDRAHEYATQAESRYAVIIAGAGGAAHLGGVVAGITTVPVIGVPMHTSSLGGVDSLYSMLQMPGGVPVAVMAIGKSGARNAAIFAAEMLAVNDPALREKLKDYKKKMAEGVVEKDSAVRQKVGVSE